MGNPKREKARGHIKGFAELGLFAAFFLGIAAQQGRKSYAFFSIILFFMFYFAGIRFCAWSVIGVMRAENTFKPLISVLEYSKLINAEAARQKVRDTIILRIGFFVASIFLSIAGWMLNHGAVCGFAYGMIVVFLMNCMETAPGQRIESMKMKDSWTDRNEVIFENEYKQFFTDERAAWNIIKTYIEDKSK